MAATWSWNQRSTVSVLFRSFCSLLTDRLKHVRRWDLIEQVCYLNELLKSEQSNDTTVDKKYSLELGSIHTYR